MDQEQPKGATLLLLDLPQSSFCGIDLFSFQTSPRFRGIKQIPPGWHLLFAAVNDAFSIRQGAWFYVPDSATSLPHVIVKSWDANVEEFVDGNIESLATTAEIDLNDARWQESLAPYRSSPPTKSEEGAGDTFDKDADWPRLTNCITEAMLSRILGSKDSQGFWSLTSANSARTDVDEIPGLGKHNPASHEEKELGFLPIDLKQTWRQGAIGRERTEAAQDRSWALSNLHESLCQQPLDVVGELQFSFLVVLTLNNNSCLEQWKRILTLLLTCKRAVVEQPDFFIEFLSTLRLQLEHSQDAEGGLFDLTEDGAPLLKLLLRRFRNGLAQQSDAAKADVMDELDELEDYLKLEYDWVSSESRVRSGILQLEDGEQVQMDLEGVDEENEMGEYAPVIVDLTPEQANSLRLDGSALPIRTNGRTKLERDVDNDSSDGHFSDESDGEEEEEDLEEMDTRY